MILDRIHICHSTSARDRSPCRSVEFRQCKKSSKQGRNRVGMNRVSHCLLVFSPLADFGASAKRYSWLGRRDKARLHSRPSIRATTDKISPRSWRGIFAGWQNRWGAGATLRSRQEGRFRSRFQPESCLARRVFSLSRPAPDFV